MINIELISPTKNAAVVRSVNGKTGEVIIEIPSIEGLATEQYVQAAIEAIDVDMTGVATEEYVAKKIAEAQLSGSDVDLSAYYTKTETDAKIDEKIAAIEIPTPEAPEIDLSGYVTVEYMENEFAPAVNEILENKADIAYVDEQIASALGGGEEHNVLYAVEEELVPVEGMFTLPNWMPLGEEYAYQPLTLEAHIRATMAESGEVVEDWMVQEAVYDAEAGVIVITDGDPLINPPEINNETGAFAAGHIFNDPSVADVVITSVTLVTGAPEIDDDEPMWVPDNLTIIDDNGTLRTAIGGFYGEPVEPQTFVEVTGSFVAVDNRIETGMVIDQEWFFHHGELRYGVEWEVEGETRVLDDPNGAWIGPAEQDEEGNIVRYVLGNFQNTDCGTEWHMEMWLSPDGVISAEAINEGFTITRFWIYFPGSPAINYINNEFIDPNYVATVDYVNGMADELRSRIEALENMPNAEEGMF